METNHDIMILLLFPRHKRGIRWSLDDICCALIQDLTGIHGHIVEISFKNAYVIDTADKDSKDVNAFRRYSGLKRLYKKTKRRNNTTTFLTR